MRKLTIMLLGLLLPFTAGAQPAPAPVKIGVLTDMSGPGHDDTGPGSIAAARMAIADYGGKALGMPIELVTGDHQNKADVASTIARRWYQTEGVDAIVDLENSSVALAAQDIGGHLGKVTVVTGSGSTELINKGCSPTGLVWNFQTTAYVRPTVQTLVKAGKTKWFTMSVDYAFGKSLEKDAADALKATGGELLGAVRFPFDTTDFSAQLLQAQSSGAQVIALGAGGGTLVNWAKQTAEFGLRQRGLTMAPLSMTIRSSHSIGLEVGQGMVFSVSFYHDQDAESRAFGERFLKVQGAPPTEMHAATYSAVTNYLRVIDAIKSKDAKAVIAKLKSAPINDFFAHGGRIRDDGLLVHDYTVFEMKTPQESHGPWDLWKLLGKVSGDDAFLPLSASTCPTVTAKP